MIHWLLDPCCLDFSCLYFLQLYSCSQFVVSEHCVWKTNTRYDFSFLKFTEDSFETSHVPECWRVPGESGPHTSPYLPQHHTHWHTRPVSSSFDSESVKKVSESRSVMFNSLQSARLFCPWDSPGRNTGVGHHAFL